MFAAMHPALSLTLLVIVEGARGALAATMRRAPETAIPGMTALWNWLTRAARRFDRILATPYVPPQARRTSRRTPRRTPARVPPTAPKPALPTWHWLRRVLRSPEINGGPSQFEQFLRNPDVHALLARDPRAVRLLRGLCRRFAIRRAPDLPAILFPTYPRKQPKAPRGTVTPKLRDPRPLIERTAVCPDTGRRTFVPWTAELAEYRRAYRLRKSDTATRH